MKRIPQKKIRKLLPDYCIDFKVSHIDGKTYADVVVPMDVYMADDFLDRTHELSDIMEKFDFEYVGGGCGVGDGYNGTYEVNFDHKDNEGGS